MDLNYELEKLKAGHSFVVGCDEVGRGCLAGPVVAAAIVMPEGLSSNPEILKIKDSKLLTAKKREELSAVIKQYCIWAISEVDEKTIDEINIHNASLLAMKKAIDRLLPLESATFDFAQDDTDKMLVCVDGKFTIPELHMKQEAVVGGDNKILSIAAASIIAKVYRDDLMSKLHIQHPQYNFSKHKGYATLLHRQKITEYGLSPHHRISFCKNFIT